MSDKKTPCRMDDDLQFHVLYLRRGIERLSKLGTKCEFPKDTTINEIGEIPGYCYVLLSGRVLCYEVAYNGDQRIYNIMEPGSIFMEDFLLVDQPCPVEFKTLEKSTLIQIEKCALKRAFKHDIDIVMDICESMAMKFLSAMEQLRLGPRQSASWKICKMLLIGAQHYGEVQADGSIIVDKQFSQQMLADLLGMNRVTVTRKLKKFKELGLYSSENGKMVFKDLSILQEYMTSMEEE